MVGKHYGVGRRVRGRDHRGLRIIVSVLVLITALAQSGCSRSETGVALTAPFNSETEIGRVTAVWETAAERRDFADAVRLKQPEVLVRYRVDVENALQDKVYLQLSDFRFIDEHGIELADSNEAMIACLLGSGKTEGVAHGSAWLPESAVTRISSFRVDPLAVPLGDPGRSLYREWLLTGRSTDTATVDAEIRRIAASPPCPGTPR